MQGYLTDLVSNLEAIKKDESDIFDLISVEESKKQAILDKISAHKARLSVLHSKILN